MSEPADPPEAAHEHWFTALWSHLGPYGRQDVHLHSCQGGEAGDCYEVFVGLGRDCADGVRHARSSLPLPDGLEVPGDAPAAAEADDTPDVHVDWHMTPAEWAELREALLRNPDGPYIARLIAEGKLGA
jgi:hypothetical protein